MDSSPSHHAPGPLVIGGMHRSGTSFTASLFAGAGVDLGPEMLGATPQNARGHFEDTGFLHFHIRALLAQGYGREGYVTHPCHVPPMLEPVALKLVAERAATGRPWGWKEPRTTLFLDFWQRLLPDARHVFVFRSPWEVVDSIFRRGDTPFVEHPSHALAVWIHYNRLIVDFVRRHPDRCVVFDIGQVIADPAGTVAAVRSRLDVPLGEPPACFEPALFTRDEATLHATLVRVASPAAVDLLEELRALAGVAPTATAGPERPGLAEVAACALAEWSRASRAESTLRALERRPEPDAAPEPPIATDTEAVETLDVAEATVEPPAPADVEVAPEPEAPHCVAVPIPPAAPVRRSPWRRLWRLFARPCEKLVKASWHALRGTAAVDPGAGAETPPAERSHAA